MIRTIDKEHIDIYKKVCAENSFDILVYTVERNHKMACVEVLYRKKELDVDSAYYFGRQIQGEIDDRIYSYMFDKVKNIL